MFQSAEVTETGILAQIGMSVNRHSASRDVDTIGVEVALSSWNRKHTKKCLKTRVHFSHTSESPEVDNLGQLL